MVNFLQCGHPFLNHRLRVGARLNRVERLAVDTGDRRHVLRRAAPSLDFENLHAAIYHLIQKIEGQNIIGRKDKIVVDQHFLA